MTAVTDNEGKVHIAALVADSDVRLTFAIHAADGVPYPPGSTVEVDLDRVLGVASQLGEAFGLAVIGVEVVHGGQ